MEGRYTSKSARFDPEGDTRVIKHKEETKILARECLGMPIEDIRQADLLSFVRLQSEGINIDYSAIADRMDYLASLCAEKFRIGGIPANMSLMPMPRKSWSQLVEDLNDEYGMIYKDNMDIERRVDRSLPNFIASHFPETHLENGIVILEARRHEPNKVCVIKDCSFDWADEFDIYSVSHGVPLTISHGTAHLARDHRILKKGNGGAITPWLFYRAFMENKSNGGNKNE